MDGIFAKKTDPGWADKSKQELIEILRKSQEIIQHLEEQTSALQKSEQSLQQEIDFTMRLIHSAPTFFITLAPDGNTLMMNDTMLNALDYQTDDVVGRNWIKRFVAPEDIESATQGLSILNNKKKPQSFTLKILSQKNTKHLVEWHCTPVLDADNNIEYIFGIGIDITERRVAAQALKESVGRYQDLFENSPDSITIVDMTGKVVNCNHATEVLTGYDKNEIIDKHFNNLMTLDPAQMKMLNGKYEQLKQGETGHPYELSIIRKDGTNRIIEVINSLMKNKDQITAFQIIARDITDRKLAEKGLCESEEKYRKVIEQSLQGIVVIQDFKIVFTNTAFAKITGYSIEELYALTPEQIKALVHPEHQAMVWGRMQERLQGKDVKQHYEYMGIQKTGSIRWLEMFAQLIEFNGKPAVQGSILDITERKNAHDAIRNAEQKFRTIFDSASDAIFIHDTAGKFLEVNKTACERLGYTRDELLNMGPADIDTQEFAMLIPKRVEQLKERGKMFFETAHLTKNGREILVELSSRIIDFGGKTVVLSVARDITERKRIQKSLEESEKKYRTLVDNALVGVYKSSLEGQLLYVNEALAGMFEYDSPSEMIRYGALQLYRNTRDRERFLKAIQESGSVNYFELELQTKNKKSLHVLVSAHIEGDILSGMIMDITERKRIEEELKNNVDKLKQLMTNTVDSMASILETRDPYTAGHQQRVAKLAEAIAEAMNLSDDQLMGLNMASLIHDIGKIYVPAEILTRPSKLTDSEFALIKTHPKVGHEILRRVDFPWPVATIVLQHHERINGSGYPQGLEGKNIILEARILAVADVVEAMSSHRPYRPAKTMEETLVEIQTNQNILYDSDVVETCLELFQSKSFSFNND